MGSDFEESEIDEDFEEMDKNILLSDGRSFYLHGYIFYHEKEHKKNVFGGQT